jgi:ankyrin repeat protein
MDAVPRLQLESFKESVIQLENRVGDFSFYAKLELPLDLEPDSLSKILRFLAFQGCQKEFVRLFKQHGDKIDDETKVSCMNIALGIEDEDEYQESDSSIDNEMYHKEIIYCLALSPGDWDYDDLFHQSCLNDHVELARHLINHPDVDPSAEECETFGLICDEGFMDVIKLLLEDKRIDPCADDNYAIQGAVENGHIEAVKLLLKNEGVDPNANSNFAIGFAAETANFEMFKLLLPHCQPEDDDNYAFRIEIFNLRNDL